MMDYLGEFYLSTSGNRVVAFGPPFASGMTLAVNSSKNGAAFAAITPAVSDLGNGAYNVAFSATDVNTLGDFSIYITSSGNDAYYGKAIVVGNNIFSTSVSANVNVTQWAGFTAATTMVAIATSVNVTAWAGFSTATTQSAIATTPAVNVSQWAGFTTATTQLAIATTAPLATTSMDAIWAVTIDGTVTAAQSMRLQNSGDGALLSGASGTNVLIRDLANTKNRVNATVDSYGNRTVATLDLT